MTVYHLGALCIAAALVLGCGLSNVCTHDGMGQVIQLAASIVGGVFGSVMPTRKAKGKSRKGVAHEKFDDS